jgi:hypothetical protein
MKALAIGRRRLLASSAPWLAAAFLTSLSLGAEPEGRKMWMSIGEKRFSIEMADTRAAREFVRLFPLTLEMPDLNGNEKHAKLPTALSAEATTPRTINKGDLMLYGTNTLVVFYEKFVSPYAYTRLGQIDRADELAPVLGPGTASITFSR